MKSILATLVLTLSCAAHAGTLVCIAGQTKPDGTFSVVTQNPVHVLVLSGTAITPYALKDGFSLFKTNYNIRDAFNMSLVDAAGSAGKFTQSGNAVTAEWALSDDGTNKLSASVSIDAGKLTGKIELNKSVSGRWAGTMMDNIVCTNAGTK